ncbi:MAG TPA: ATP-binding cassette domain-containing protein [Puia sp.]|nr:ATP-binding cassette domain-containing protein [Puia sp.]
MTPETEHSFKKTPGGIDRKNAVISLRGVHKSFGDLDVLKGVDLDVYKGENLVVLGRSGSGKSVLLKIISGLLRPDRGAVHVLGQEIDRLNTRELQALRSKIGFSFQSSALYDGMNVRANLEFPLVRNQRTLTRREIDEAVIQVLDDVGLPQTIDQMPSQLSGGQKKRIGIARTLILHPEIMLYDEPTAGLDPVTSVEINDLINEVQQRYNTSSVVITHDLTCARSTGDRIVMISEGVFLRQGSFDEVFDTSDPRVQNFYNYNFITRHE